LTRPPNHRPPPPAPRPPPQVAAEAARLCEGGNLKVVCTTGGADAAGQRLALRGGADLLVATPGRLLDLARRGTVGLGNLRWLVLEEAEALLAPGLDAAVRGVAALRLQHGGGAPGGAPSGAAGAAARAAAAAAGAPPGEAGGAAAPLQTVAVASSAADVPALLAGAADLLRPGALLVSAAMPDGPAASPAAPPARQRAVGVAGKLKPRALLRLLADSGASSGAGGAALVCCASAAGADAVHAGLERAGVPAGVLHAGRSQAERDEALQCFRYGVTRVLVAAGLAARGLDLPDVTLVINYEPPSDAGEYAKRLARLGRGAGVVGAGGPGAPGGGAVTLVSPEDAPRAGALVGALRAAGAAPPDWLVEMAEQHAAAAGGGGSSAEGLGGGAGGGPGGGEGGRGSGGGASGGRLFSVRRPPGAEFGSYLPMPSGAGAGSAGGSSGGGSAAEE
jgi:superfamily II DNA/RNA helicase